MPEAAVAEALLDERVRVPREACPPALAERLETAGWLDPGRRDASLIAVAEAARARTIAWAAHTLTQGEVLDAFAAHCEDELEDVGVVERAPTLLVTRWRSEVSRFEVRAGTLGIERLASDTPTMVLTRLGDEPDELVRLFLDDPSLRSRLAVCDLDRLERLGTVRSSAFVYLEWFLRDAYGVKLLPVAAFTRGLIDRGVISLGMG
jgi:hypothetical protein